MDLMDVTGLPKKKLKMDHIYAARWIASSSSPTSSSSTARWTVSSSSPTSSSSTARWKYDVFLSFRGEDTRYSFTDLIYAALIKEDINTFKDDVNLEKGKRISELFKKIEQSRFAIVIFSKDYASSKWCLDELAKIVQCEKEMGMTILPVFYDVEPSDVRPEKKGGTFALALIEHEKKSTEKVQQWRDALTHVSYISGWPVMNRRQSEVIQNIVDRMISEKRIEDWSLTYEKISSDLNKTMSVIHAVLKDAEEKQVKNQGPNDWLGQVKDVFYDAEDVQDEFDIEARRHVVETHGSTDSASYTSFNLRDFCYKIKVIRERFNEIGEVRARFHLVEQHDDKHIVHRELTHSFVHHSDVIGRVEDKEKIKDLLMHPSEDGTVPVISIVGIGGMGKTTLAQWVYNDEWIVENFDPKIWVCVSEEFNVSKLAKEILKKSAGNSISENMDKDEVQASLRSNLKEKRFLIVLDDVWNEDRKKWIDLKNLLIKGANGSKIVVTTRSDKVARVMAPGPIHNLIGLPEDDCLFLFLKWAFAEGQEKQHLNLIEIGKQIVKKCCGVPLAVRTLGSLLYFKTEERDWISVRDNEIWKLEQKEDDILPALRLSYNQLPSDLKQCFAYCSLYPKDFRYGNLELIQSWMANGLLQRFNKSARDLEDIGQQYLNELLSRSFFQEIKQYDHLSFSFKIHDLLHDLSLHVAQNDYYCLIDNTKSTKNFEKARHVSIWDKNLGGDEATRFLCKLSNNVRTIIFQGNWNQAININKSFVEICISKFKHLRLLDLRFSTLEALPSPFGTLKHLRYLNLEWNKHIKKLPNSLCDLQNLETLLLTGCDELEELPRDIRKMVSIKYFWITTKQTCLPTNEIMSMCSLRDLYFYNCPGLESFPEGIQRLTALRRLAFQSCESLISLPQGLKHLTALESLIIWRCEKINLMEGEDYPTSLRSFTISGSPKLVALPQWLIQSATTLQFLQIDDCYNLAALPEWPPNLTSLQKLQIRGCQKLSSLPEGMGCLTALRELQIINCGELSKNCEREVGVEWPKIKHIPQIDIQW